MSTSPAREDLEQYVGRDARGSRVYPAHLIGSWHQAEHVFGRFVFLPERLRRDFFRYVRWLIETRRERAAVTEARRVREEERRREISLGLRPPLSITAVDTA
jgi:hypothetical protein